MAVPALKPYRLKALLCKLETTYGTDPTPTPATDGVLAQNLTIALEADKLERPLDRGFIGANPFVLVNKRVSLEFDFEPLGNTAKGTAAPCGPLLQACAHSETLVASTSATYAPITSSLKSATCYFNMAGQQVAVTGCRGSIDIDFTVRQYPKAHCKLTGMFAIPTGVALVAPTLTAWQSPVPVELETFLVSVAGTAVNATSFVLSCGQAVNIHEASETREAAILSRSGSGTFKLYDPGVSGTDSLDLWTPANTYVSKALIASVSGSSGKIVTVNVPFSQLELPKWVEYSDAVGLEVGFAANPSVGNDEYSIVFT